MYLGKKNEIKFAIIKGDKDLVRLIFTRADDNKYDIKIVFRGNPYQINTYRLFAFSPVNISVSDTANKEMSYHHGANGYPILIHIKDLTKTGSEKYQTLPIERLVPPNSESVCPIPLMKLEIPEAVINSAPKYKHKNDHNTIDLKTSNVLEIFMAQEDFGDKLSLDKNQLLIMPLILLSMEYFSSNTVISDYSKSTHFMPHDLPEVRMRYIGKIQGMSLMINNYSVPEFEEHFTDIHVTFIENELAEEILLCTKFSPPVNPNMGFMIGGSSINDLKPNCILLKCMTIVKNSIVDECLRRKSFSEEESQKLTLRAESARSKLYSELSEFNNKLEKDKDTLLTTAEHFLSAYEKMQKELKSIKTSEAVDNIMYLNNVEQIILTSNILNSELIHILFARYLGITQFELLRIKIQSKKIKKNKKLQINHDQNGILILPKCTLTTRNAIFSHVWLKIDDILSIDLLHGDLNWFLKNKKDFPRIRIMRTKPYYKDDNWDGMRKLLNDNSFICSQIQSKKFYPQDVEYKFQNNTNYIDTIYEMLNLYL